MKTLPIKVAQEKIAVSQLGLRTRKNSFHLFRLDQHFIISLVLFLNLSTHVSISTLKHQRRGEKPTRFVAGLSCQHVMCDLLVCQTCKFLKIIWLKWSCLVWMLLADCAPFLSKSVLSPQSFVTLGNVRHHVEFCKQLQIKLKII